MTTIQHKDHQLSLKPIYYGPGCGYSRAVAVFPTTSDVMALKLLSVLINTGDIKLLASTLLGPTFCKLEELSCVLSMIFTAT